MPKVQKIVTIEDLGKISTLIPEIHNHRKVTIRSRLINMALVSESATPVRSVQVIHYDDSGNQDNNPNVYSVWETTFKDPEELPFFLQVTSLKSGQAFSMNVNELIGIVMILITHFFVRNATDEIEVEFSN